MLRYLHCQCSGWSSYEKIVFLRKCIPGTMYNHTGWYWCLPSFATGSSRISQGTPKLLWWNGAPRHAQSPRELRSQDASLLKNVAMQRTFPHLGRRSPPLYVRVQGLCTSNPEILCFRVVKLARKKNKTNSGVIVQFTSPELKWCQDETHSIMSCNRDSWWIYSMAHCRFFKIGVKFIYKIYYGTC